ncbi:MAG: Phosphocarrier protein HPr [Candidatus Izimaplasma bacterium HR2]|nr:MAG: Phosphocarrier protein HPr [Candidatus Izimaplasma bacterium HR2]
MEKEFIIANEKGLHARPATLLVSIASKFDCNITVTYDGVTVDLKSIMNVLSLGLKRGSLITIRTDGVDEVAALKKISENIVNFNLR